MNRKLGTLDHVISGLLKLDPSTRERQNVISFFQSCYGGRVREYDFDAAQKALKQLTDVEYQSLAEYVVDNAEGQKLS